MKQKKVQSLSRKLFVNFILSCLLPIVVVSFLVSYLFGTYQYQEIRSRAENNTKLISAYMTKYLNDIDNLTKAPYYHSFFQSRTPFEDLTPYDQNKVGEEIGKLLQLTTYSREDFGDMLVMSDGNVLYFNTSDWYQYLPTIHPLTGRSWYQSALDKNGRVAIIPEKDMTGADEEEELDTGSFYISRKLNNMFLQDQENVIMLNLKTDDFENLFSSLTSKAPLIIAFTNDEDQLIYSNKPLTKTQTAALKQQKVNYDHRNWLCFSQTLEHYPLTDHVLQSASYVIDRMAIFLFMAAACCLLCSILGYAMFKKNNYWIERPTYHIKAVLGELQVGNLNSRCEPLVIREFNEIGTSINAMAKQLQETIRNEYELKLAQKNLQLQALQSQIQPHFIINTIYSFITLNQIGEQEALNDAFYSFAHLLRYVLSRSRETTLGAELDFLNDYCSLCLLRFGNRLSYEINCSEEFKSLSMPKLLLQPLVENAVIHGIEPSEVPCKLFVEAERHGNSLYILIEDDGVGFKEEELNSPESIGIKNVENRISLWGPDIRLYIYRIDGRTIQVLIVPFKEEKHEDTGDRR